MSLQTTPKSSTAATPPTPSRNGKPAHTPSPIFLADNTRFKLCFNKAGNATNFHGWQNLLDGRWVALVPAEDDSHMELYALRRQSLKLAVATRHRDELLAALKEAREALQFANENPSGGISDTIWMMHRPETLFDFMDAAIAKATGSNSETGGGV